MNLPSFDMTYLPEILALALLIGCFRPLVRRAGPHVNLWFAAWCFLLLHFLTLACLLNSGISCRILMLVSRWSLDLCALASVLIAESRPAQRISLPHAFLLPIPVLLQAALALYPVHPPALDRLCILLFLGIAAYLLFAGKRSLQSLLLGGAYFSLAAISFCVPGRPILTADTALSILFLIASGLFLHSAPRASRGVVVGFLGLAAWGLTYPAASLWSHVYPALPLPRVLLEVPILLMAGGIILALLEEHVLRTERLATHDPLTDLPNRRMFEQRLFAALEEAREQRTTIACLAIDIDNFKTINDTMGHDAGDQLLKAIAVRLSWNLGARDMLARTGGDEFTALLAGVHDEHHLKFVASAMMSAASVPIMLDGEPVDVGISIGIALSPDHADDTDGLRRAADLAMYSAKRRGGSLLAFAGEE